MAREQDPVNDAVHMVQLFDATIYLSVGPVLEKSPQNLALKNMSNEVE